MYSDKNLEHNKFHTKITLKTAMRMIALLIMAIILIGFIFLPVSSYAQSGENKIVRVGWYDSNYCYFDQSGRRCGIAYDYQQKLVPYTGWSYEYVEGTWPELLQMLKDGRIDMLSDVSYTSERALSILYPDVPMGTESYYIFVKAGNTSMTLDDMSSFENKVFAVDKSSVLETLIKEWAQRNAININIREITEQSVAQCIEMLKNGEIDAYVTIDSYGDTDSCMPICQIGSSEYYFAVNKDRPDLLKELNAALVSIQNDDPYYNQKLMQKYVWSSNANAYLTDKENEWLSGHGKIRVGYRNNYLPFCTEDFGKLTGALGDFLTKSPLLLKNAEVEFETVPFATTDGSLKALEEGQIDAVFPINLSPYDLENRGLLSSVNIMDTEIFAVVNPNLEKDIFKDEDIRVALLSGNVNFDIYVKDYHPLWTIEHYSTIDDCYKAVHDGDAECALVNSYRITQNDRTRKRYGLSLLATGEDIDFSFAVKKENTELFSILNKLIKISDPAEIEQTLSQHSVVKEKVTFEDYLYDNSASVVALAVLVLSIIFFLMLLKIRSDRKADDRQKLISATELDPLTKLYTRNFFFEYAMRLYKEHPEQKMDAVVMNIEQFHVVNALYGWDFGDKVLKALGEEIKAFVSENGGIACRSQADRYDLYFDHQDDYMPIYERFQKALDNFSDNVNIRVRMGVMPYHPDLGPVELFDRARTACSMIRSGHQIKLIIFNEEMREREILEQRLLSDIKYAVDFHEIMVYFQPKYNVQVDPPVLKSAEALVRWKHNKIGMIPPVEFINLFEKHGQIGIIDKYVWEETARQISEWKKKYGFSVPVSVNLSRIDIFDPNLIETIEELTAKYDISKEDLFLEVTESAYTEDTDQIIGVVKQLRNLGYHIEMDDFGTGYSSLNMLSSMPVDVLKLDKSFINNIQRANSGESKDTRLVELILNIAKSLQLKVVAEGVETEDQFQFLKDHGCDMIQGYYFSKPLPAEEFEKLAFKKQ